MGLLTNLAAKIDNVIRKETTTRGNVGADALADAKAVAAMSSQGKSEKAKAEKSQATKTVMKEISPVRSAVVEAGKTAPGRAVSYVTKEAIDFAASMQKKFTEISSTSKGKSAGNSGLPSKAQSKSQTNQL